MIYVLNSKYNFKSPHISICTAEDIMDFLSDNKEFGLDTETSGLNPFKDRLICISLGNDKDQFLIDARYDDWTFLKDYLESLSWIKILANAGFDYKFLLPHGVVMNKVFDVIHSDLALSQDHKSYMSSLQDLLSSRLNIEIGKETRSSFIGMTDEFLTENQIIYACEDVKHLPQLKSDLETEAFVKKTKVLDLENAMSLVLADMEYEGIRLDTDAWKTLADIAQQRRSEFEHQLDREIETDPLFQDFRMKYFQTDMFVPDDQIRKVAVNWASPKQVLKVVKAVDKTANSIEAGALQDLYKKHTIIPKLLGFSEWGKRCTTYGMDFLNHLWDDERIRTRFFPIVSTGRLSSQKPNMQNIPANNDYRNCFIPNYDDWVFVTADFSSQELAIIAWGAQDPVWLKALEEDKDLHSICAELLFGDKWKNTAEPGCNFYKEEDGAAIKQKCSCPKHKKLRDLVKTLNFGLAYGLTAHSFSGRMGTSVEDAERLISDYYAAFPKIESFMKSLSYFAKSKGFMVTMKPFFRLRKFKNWKGYYTDRNEMSSIERMGRNTHIQGTGADMVKLALVLTRKHINENNLRDKVKIVLTVHDEINTITTKEFSNTWKLMLKEIMEKAAQVIVPSRLIKADPAISLQWEK